MSDLEKTRKDAEQGNAESQFKLGCMYARGEGVQKDFSEAEKWLDKSAKQGHGKAIVLLKALRKVLHCAGSRVTDESHIKSFEKEDFWKGDYLTFGSDRVVRLSDYDYYPLVELRNDDGTTKKEVIMLALDVETLIMNEDRLPSTDPSSIGVNKFVDDAKSHRLKSPNPLDSGEGVSITC